MSIRSNLGYLLAAMLCHGGIAAADELRIASPHWEGYKREFEWSFIDWYRQRTGREISLRWLELGGASDVLRYILGQARLHPGGDLGIDLFFGGGVDPYVELKRQGLLLPVDLPPGTLDFVPPEISGNPVYDPERHWFSVNLAGFGIIFNKRLIETHRFPKPERWRDLADPRYAGWIGSADPRKSGSVRFMYELILQYYGWEEGWRVIYGIGANIRTFNNYASQTPKDIALGEIAAGPIIDSYARDAIREAGEDKVGFVMPTEFSAVYGDAIAVLRGTPRKETAALFVEFSLSRRAQELLVRRTGTQGGPRRYEIGKMSVRRDIYEIPAAERFDFSPPWDVSSPFRYDPALASERWAVVTMLLGGVVVDLKEELQEAARYDPDLARKIPPPLSSDAALKLSRSLEWKDPAFRQTVLDESRRAVLAALPKSRRRDVAGAVPSIIVFVFVGILATRRILKGRG